MKPYTGYEAKKHTGREMLPAGGYVIKILDVKEIPYDWGTVFDFSFDIIEGTYQNFFRTDYNNQNMEDKKWRGKYRLTQPKDDGSEKDGWTKNTFNNAMYALENSNKGYAWNWNEDTLKGLTVGALFREKEWEMNGQTGWTYECCSFTVADDIREGSFKIPKAKPLANKKTPAPTVDDFEEILGSDDLPF